jgi:hypothetical protein
MPEPKTAGFNNKSYEIITVHPDYVVMKKAQAGQADNGRERGLMPLRR